MNKIVNYEIGDLFIQRGLKRVNKNNAEIDYVDDVTKLDDNYNVDYSGVDNIYQLYGYNVDRYMIRRFDRLGFSFDLDNMSFDEFNKRFIRLADFLKDATFVGREFRRTQPVYRYGNVSINTGFVRGIRRLMTCFEGVIRDSSFMNSYLDGSKIVVLYMKDNVFLVRKMGNSSFFNDEYRIIGCDYTCDGNYEFFGKVYEEYRDRDKVYYEIVEQINSYNKKDVKTRIRRR